MDNGKQARIIGVINMRFVKTRALVYPFLILLVFGCGVKEVTQPEPVPQKPVVMEPKPEKKFPPEMVEEYARIHQIADLKTAEFYLANPDYAKEHPYTPTSKDIELYERDFLEKMYPGFKKMVEKDGFMKARHRYMTNPPAGPGSRHVGSKRYGVVMQKIAAGGGEGASTGTENPEAEVDPVTIYYREGMRLYKIGELDGAIEQMEKAVQAKPDAPSILYDLGVMYMGKGDRAKAIHFMQESVRYIKSTGLTKINLAMYPDVYMGALTNLGLMYTRIGMYEEAVKALKEALQFRSHDLDANYNLVNAYYVMGDMDKTATQLRKFINLDPENAEAHNIAGLIYYRRQLHNAALDEFQTAEKLNPNEKQYSHNLGTALAKLGRNEEANQAFQRASGLEEGADMRRNFAEQTEANEIRKLYNNGHTAMEVQNWSQAVDYFKAVLERKPDMMEAHLNLGFCYRMQGDVKNQIRYFAEAARLKPDMPNIHHNLGLAYSDARMYPQAIAEFKKAVELDPSLKDAHFSLGMALFKTDKYADAAAQFEKSLELSPDWVEAHLNLGTCYLKTEKENDAIEQFEKAAQLKPNSAEAQYNLGIVYRNRGQFDKASEFFQKALKIDPAYKQARVMLKESENYQGKQP